MESPERDYKDRTLWDPLVEPLLDLATETESHDLLVEVSQYQAFKYCDVQHFKVLADPMHPSQTNVPPFMPLQ